MSTRIALVPTAADRPSRVSASIMCATRHPRAQYMGIAAKIQIVRLARAVPGADAMKGLAYHQTESAAHVMSAWIVLASIAVTHDSMVVCCAIAVMVYVPLPCASRQMIAMARPVAAMASANVYTTAALHLLRARSMDPVLLIAIVVLVLVALCVVALPRACCLLACVGRLDAAYGPENLEGLATTPPIARRHHISLVAPSCSLAVAAQQ